MLNKKENIMSFNDLIDNPTPRCPCLLVLWIPCVQCVLDSAIERWCKAIYPSIAG